jgi:uncharacterized protein Yka (UPF0111/DUF47 family)
MVRGTVAAQPKAFAVSNKSLIIEDLGEHSLLLPQALAAALTANDRIKLCFTVLQAAQQHVEHPEAPPPDLSAELRALEIDPQFATAVMQSRRDAEGTLWVPGATQILQLIRTDVAAMRAPLALAQTADAASFEIRERQLLESLASITDDHLPAGIIAKITRAQHSSVTRVNDTAESDSLHRLVMDLHKALNALQSSLSQETIDGAHVWRILESDRPLVRAFIGGVNETAPLKFNHPGLDTTATRVGNQLVIQNDIGTTDAHVLVVRVEDTTATLTYTDVHSQRLEFFQSLFSAFAVSWSEPSARHNDKLAETQEYRLVIGRFNAADQAALQRYLTFLGSRIVFLIDWNHARKRLREFISKADAVRVLKWAADHNIGHRGFIELGGERLLQEAIEFAQRAPARYGERLHETLGSEVAYDFIRFVLRECTTGLMQRRSERFIRDEIKAELARRFRSSHASILLIGLKHAERVFDLAITVQEGMLRYAEPQGAQMLQQLGGRARSWEQECDGIVSQVRSLARRTTKPEVYADLLHTSDEAADGLEEAAFLMTHLPAISPGSDLMDPLRALAALLVAGAQESVKMYEVASHVTREGEREDVQDFFAAVDRVVAIEHDTDTAERCVTSALLASTSDAKSLYLAAALGTVLEEAADGMALAALKLRDHLLNDVMAG